MYLLLTDGILNGVMYIGTYDRDFNCEQVGNWSTPEPTVKWRSALLPIERRSTIMSMNDYYINHFIGPIEWQLSCSSEI